MVVSIFQNFSFNCNPPSTCCTFRGPKTFQQVEWCQQIGGGLHFSDVMCQKVVNKSKVRNKSNVNKSGAISFVNKIMMGQDGLFQNLKNQIS